MPNICLSCGEQEDFETEASGTAVITRTHYYDEHNNMLATDNEDYGHINITEESTMLCSTCGSNDVRNLSEENWENFDLDFYIETGEYWDKGVPKTWKEKMTND